MSGTLAMMERRRGAGKLEQRRQLRLRGRALTLVCLGMVLGNGDTAVNPTDLKALTQLQRDWGMDASGWGSGDVCTWHGVGCGASGTSVIQFNNSKDYNNGFEHAFGLLSLQAASISGAIPAAIGSFTSLQQLDLSFNIGLVGPIPPEIGQLSNLTSLTIQACKLTGTIPSTIGNLKNLTFLDLSGNSFDPQPFPSWIQNAPNLQIVYLESDNLIGGFPSAVFSAPKLKALWARQNSLKGTLRIPVMRGPHLTTIFLQENRFTAIAQTILSPNMTQVNLQLAGNPVCTASHDSSPVAYCDATATRSRQLLQSWTSNPTPASNCSSTICKGTTVVNPFLSDNCNCSQPLEVLLEALQPKFSVITDAVMETLQGELASELRLQKWQVWVTDAAFKANNNGSCKIHVAFFAADGGSMPDGDAADAILHSLTSNGVDLPSVKPYAAENASIDKTKPKSKKKKKKKLSTGQIVGIVVGCTSFASCCCGFLGIGISLI